MKRTAAAGLKIDVVVDSDVWKDAGAARDVVRRAVRPAAVQAGVVASTSPAELAIVLTDDAAMRGLNRNWRGVDAATNVLSFATINAGGRRFIGHLGDIVLAYETVKREARRERKTFAHHLAHLTVHGFLHLLGYDHASDAQAREMEETERAILRAMAVPDPYRARPTAGRAVKRPAKQHDRGRARSAQKTKIARVAVPKTSNG